MASGYDEITATMQQEDEAARRHREAQEIKRQNEALITKWQDKVKRARKHDSKAREQWADDRRVARGDPPPGEKEWLVQTNLIAPILDVLAAFLYAKNPDISVRPSPSVSPMLKKESRLIAETLEVVVSRILKDAYLKRVAKRWVRASMTVGVSWIKAAMQTRTERDPIVEQNLNDLKDNMDRLQAKQQKLADGDVDNEDSEKAEIRANITALEGQLERQIAEGMTLDLMAPEDVVVSRECGEIENYLIAPWMSFDYYKDEDDAIELTGWELDKLKTANTYTQRPRKGHEEEGHSGGPPTQWVQVENEGDEGTENPDGFYRFTEIWSLEDGVVYTFVDGIAREWAREPYAPRTGKRFYPAFLLAFSPTDGDRWPQSDVYRLKSLQDEYNRTRSNYALHRMRAIPGIMVNATIVAPEDVRKLNNSEVQEWTPIKPNSTQDVDMRSLFAQKPYNPVDPALYRTDVIIQEMEKISGAQDAVQGAIQVEKTATEAQILESGRGARTGARLDALEDSLTELAEYAMQLCLLTMDKADAMRYAGPNAAWMDMTPEEALTLFSLEIKAGSTGKPKALSDRESWATLMPLIEGMIDRVGHAKMMGQEWAAEPWVNLLRESSKRLDDPLEVEKFIPEVPPEVAQAMGGNQPSEQEQAETAKTEAETDAKKADTIKTLAEALEINPLFAGPAMQSLARSNGQGEPQPEPGIIQ
jgi:hypothetical protein